MLKRTLLTEHIWTDYFDRFDYFSRDTVRPGCEPRYLKHEHGSARAIVLVHGLSDSPYFVSAIGDFFHFELGYNVYMPLLHFHGLRDPQGMEGVELEEWEDNVAFAIDCAKEGANHISIGGLSTGGVLSLAAASSNPSITSAMYLFSAALSLAGGFRGLLGEMKEILLKTFLVDLLDRNKEFIGDNPYRYSHVDLDGARELARLIKRTDTIIKGFSTEKPFPLPVFAAHSEADTTANIEGIENLRRICTPDAFTFIRFPEEDGIPHASVVLCEPISGIEKPEPANPRFEEMMQAVKVFTEDL